MPFIVHHILTQAVESLTTHGVPNPRLDAEVLLAHVLGLTRTGLYAHLHEDLSEPDNARFQQVVNRRQQREPLQYITGMQEFWSLEFRVTPDVLIPRPETELVVETALRVLAQPQVVSSQHSVVSREEKSPASEVWQSAIHNPPAPSIGGQSTIRILDVGTGSGCIAIALAKELPEVEVWAIDISEAALAVAQGNAQRHGLTERIHFLQGDLFTPFRGQQLSFDLIVSNPPYIVHADIPLLQPEVGNWEPRRALDGGPDGLDFYHRLLCESPNHLRTGGYLVMEIGSGQSTDILHLAKLQSELTGGSCLLDYEGRERVVFVQKR
jgi:release factor glutamine methyltransferase